MWAYNHTMTSDEIYHHGTKGMKWGVRRFQNPDGTLTDEGKRRYYQNSDGSYSTTARLTGARKAMAMESSKAANSSKNMADSIFKIVSAKQKSQLDVSELTDKELKEVISRMNLEQQYKDLMVDKGALSTGKTYVTEALSIAGNALAVTASSLGIALAVKQLKQG